MRDTLITRHAKRGILNCSNTSSCDDVNYMSVLLQYISNPSDLDGTSNQQQPLKHTIDAMNLTYLYSKMLYILPTFLKYFSKRLLPEQSVRTIIIKNRGINYITFILFNALRIDSSILRSISRPIESFTIRHN